MDCAMSNYQLEKVKQSKEDYLRRYLAGGENKKLKRRRTKHIKKSVIIDDDVDVKSCRSDDEDARNLDDDLVQNLPTIADFIDERPTDVIQLEKFRQDGRWKVLADDDESSCERHDTDSDGSSASKNYPAKQRHDSDSESEAAVDRLQSKSSLLRRKPHRSDSDQSPQRNKHCQSDSDQSPPRRKRQQSDSDQSPPRRKRHQSDSDQSPPRRKRHQSDSDQSPPRRKQRQQNSDQPSPRRTRYQSDCNQSPSRTHTKYNDVSASRKRQRDTEEQTGKEVKTGKTKSSRWSNESSNKDSEGQAKKTLGGSKAGLSTALEMRDEAVKLKQREKQAFNKIDRALLGKDAKTVFRDKKSGKKRNLVEEKEQEREKQVEEEKRALKYANWGKGLKQGELQAGQLASALHEIQKPLARYSSDVDLDATLREKEREGDPMLAYMQKKKAQVAKKDVARYKGREPPANRFNMWPGYRWDGVDRSNGFEQKLFAKISEKKTIKDLAYKWSVEDM